MIIAKHEAYTVEPIAVYCISKSLSTNAAYEDPLIILRSFVEYFGFRITIAGERRKFYFDVKIELPNPGARPNLSRSITKVDHFVAASLFKLIHPTLLNASLVYAIDLTKYQDWLASSERQHGAPPKEPLTAEMTGGAMANHLEKVRTPLLCL